MLSSVKLLSWVKVSSCLNGASENIFTRREGMTIDWKRQYGTRHYKNKILSNLCTFSSCCLLTHWVRLCCSLRYEGNFVWAAFSQRSVAIGAGVYSQRRSGGGWRSTARRLRVQNICVEAEDDADGMRKILRKINDSWGHKQQTEVSHIHLSVFPARAFSHMSWPSSGAIMLLQSIWVKTFDLCLSSCDHSSTLRSHDSDNTNKVLIPFDFQTERMCVFQCVFQIVCVCVCVCVCVA